MGNDSRLKNYNIMKTLINVIQEEDGTITVSSDVYPIRIGQVLPESKHPELVQELKKWRWDLAREQNVPAYIIVTNRTIQNIADSCPGNEDELLSINGIGPATLEKYGQDILAIVARYVESHTDPETGEI